MRELFAGLQKFKEYNMISFKQFLMENDILEDDNTPKDGVTLYYGYKKDRKHDTCFVAVEYENGELVNVYDKIDFNYSMPFDGSTGKISKSATKRSNEVVQNIEKMSGKSITKKVEMYLKTIFSSYAEVETGITVEKFIKLIKDYFDVLIKQLQSLYNKLGSKKYDDYMHYRYNIAESEDDQFEEEVKFIKKFIKKHLR